MDTGLKAQVRAVLTALFDDFEEDKQVMGEEAHTGNTLVPKPLPDFIVALDDGGETVSLDDWGIAATLSIWVSRGVRIRLVAASAGEVQSCEAHCSGLEYFTHHLAKFMEIRDANFHLQ